MKMWMAVVGIVTVLLVNLYIRSWQCAELFPNANRWACVLWK
jgi:hypothetical protein